MEIAAADKPRSEGILLLMGHESGRTGGRSEEEWLNAAVHTDAFSYSTLLFCFHADGDVAVRADGAEDRNERGRRGRK
jgi:hypothetical protein